MWVARSYATHTGAMKEDAAMHARAIHHVHTDVSGAEALTGQSSARRSRIGSRQERAKGKAMEKEKAKERKVQDGDLLGIQQGAW